MTTRQLAFSALFKLKKSGVRVDEQLAQLADNSGVPESVVKFLKENSPQYQFYSYLQKRQKSLLQNLVKYESLGPVEKVKVGSSMITRAMIAVEYKEINPTLIEELRLDRVANALSEVLQGGDDKVLDTAMLSHLEFVKEFMTR